MSTTHLVTALVAAFWAWVGLSFIAIPALFAYWEVRRAARLRRARRRDPLGIAATISELEARRIAREQGAEGRCGFPGCHRDGQPVADHSTRPVSWALLCPVHAGPQPEQYNDSGDAS